MGMLGVCLFVCLFVFVCLFIFVFVCVCLGGESMSDFGIVCDVDVIHVMLM